MRLVIALLLCLIMPPYALADTHSVTCSGTITTALQNAINAATGGTTYADGDVVAIGAGSCSMGSITLSKKITLQGAGSASTLISGGSISFSDSAPRITGIGFTGTTFDIEEGTAGATNGFRIDHNSMTWTTNDVSILIKGNTASTCTTHPTGVIDNNYFTEGQLLIYGDMATGESNGDDMWYLTDALGATTNVIYIETNTFYASSVTPYAIDANYGGRYVARFNTITNRSWEHHGIQGDTNRGVPRWEIYNNAFTSSSAYWAPLYIRSGGGPVFNNTADSGFSGWIAIDNQTSCRYGDGGVACDGANPRDGNRTGLHGYPCRDQIGRVSGDNPKGHTGDTQKFFPLYSWNNKLDGTEGTVELSPDVECSRNEEHIAVNRDYYNGASGTQTSKTSPFNGTSGVGYGTKANIPDTCTTSSESGGGVAYWATDEGAWNQSGSGGQGRLYQCTATNTWSLVYTPATYPHPLRGEGTTPAPIRIHSDLEGNLWARKR